MHEHNSSKGKGFSEYGKLIFCGLKSLESLTHYDVIFDVPCGVYPMNSLSMLLQY